MVGRASSFTGKDRLRQIRNSARNLPSRVLLDVHGWEVSLKFPEEDFLSELT